MTLQEAQNQSVYIGGVWRGKDTSEIGRRLRPAFASFLVRLILQLSKTDAQEVVHCAAKGIYGPRDFHVAGTCRLPRRT